MTNRQPVQTWSLGLLFWGLITSNLVIGQSTDKLGSVADSIKKYRTLMAARYPTGVSAHRGNSQLAPENTLATFREVLKMQVDYIEIDVRTTQDGQLIILHDGSLNRTSTGTGPVSDQPLSALKTLSAGKGFADRFQTERIPTLAEVCQLVAHWNATHPTPTNLYVDCKAVAPAPLVETLQTYGLLKNAVFYGSDDALLALKQVAPTARLMPSLRKAEEMPDKINKLNPYAFDLNWLAVNETLIQQIHQQGVKAFSDLLGPLDSPEQYRKAAHIGIDVIQTDYVISVYQTLAQSTK
ncbi:glycerophosphodiester phosphodiesterase [Spirosoma radiotolerans]|uniref:Glycerophosphodiester phosphodiesterase n=1 Tax=Spirosoma radiotolerans TaxID=1379870 RepID=A0A0E3ZSJ3_9BACT|nr:glycerophosphodiester phosphodiesterase family protein [Spirosoma radiotolerans]AKD54405.1 glycerophosphodiester phosphodiesterase [Spirosoma radiotolerans]